MLVIKEFDYPVNIPKQLQSSSMIPGRLPNTTAKSNLPIPSNRSKLLEHDSQSKQFFTHKNRGTNIYTPYKLIKTSLFHRNSQVKHCRKHINFYLAINKKKGHQKKLLIVDIKIKTFNHFLVHSKQSI